MLVFSIRPHCFLCGLRLWPTYKNLLKPTELLYIRQRLSSKGKVLLSTGKVILLTRKLARDWGMRREVELQESSVYAKRGRLTVGNVIERYIKGFMQQDVLITQILPCCSNVILLNLTFIHLQQKI